MAATEKQKANLIPPKKGEVRNPKGKPKGTLNSKTVIRKWLEMEEDITNPITKKKERMTQFDAISLAQLAKARNGNTQSFNALVDRVDGKPAYKVDLNANVNLSDEPIDFE